MFTTTAVGAVLAGALLAGCSSGPSATEKKYADAVAAADPDDFGGIDTGKLASTLGSEGSDLCDQLKASYDDAIAYAKTGYSQKEAEALVAAAVLVNCPNQKSKMPSS